jgi:hypothetical protein
MNLARRVHLLRSQCAAAAAAVTVLLAFAGLLPAQEQDTWSRLLHNQYTLEVELDPLTRTLRGTETVVYTHRDSKPTQEVIFHLYPNAFSNDGSVFLQELRRNVGHDPFGKMSLQQQQEELGYCYIESLQIGQTKPAVRVDCSRMYVPLSEPLQPGESVEIHVVFHTKLPKTMARMGYFADHYDVMQWFPKLAAFDAGQFNDEPFHAATEFFANFGRYDVTIITPERFVVGASGVLQEERPLAAEGNLGPRVARRYVAEMVHDFAWCADPYFQVFTDDFEYDDGQVVEIIYLCQPYAVEKANRVLSTTRKCLELYGKWFKPYPYQRVTIDGLPFGLGGGMEYPMLFTVSQRFPNHLSYLANVTEQPVGLTAHEFGHQYWYGILASNEFTEAWVDEGINTYVSGKVEQEYWNFEHGRPLQSMEWREVLAPFLNEGVSVDLGCCSFGYVELLGFPTSPFATVRRGRPSQPTLLGFRIPTGRLPGFHQNYWLGRRSSYFPVANKSTLQTTSYEMHPQAYGPLTYSKTALALATLEQVFGWEPMRRALQEYVERFWFRHPSGEDFLDVLREVLPPAARELNAAADKNPPAELEPYLQQLFYQSGRLDYAVTRAECDRIEPPRGYVPAAIVGEMPQFQSPAEPQDDAGYRYRVLVENLAEVELPVDVLLGFAGGKTSQVHWDGKRRYRWIEGESDTSLEYAVVDPDGTLLLDCDHNNNGRSVERNERTLDHYRPVVLYWVEQYLNSLRLLMGP